MVLNIFHDDPRKKKALLNLYNHTRLLYKEQKENKNTTIKAFFGSQNLSNSIPSLLFFHTL